MISRTLRFLAAVAAVLALQAPAVADDTDLFAQTQPAKPANILLIFDNGASFSSAGGSYCNIDPVTDAVSVTTSSTNATALGKTNGAIEQCALYSSLKAQAVSPNVKIAIMMFNSKTSIYDPSSGSFVGSCSNTVGGCVVLNLSTWNATTKANTLSWIKQWTISGNSNYMVKGPSSTSNGGIMQEAYAFFQGKTGISGTQYAYVDPGCGNNYIIYVGNAYDGNTAPGDQTGVQGPLAPLSGTGPSGTNASPAATTEIKYNSTDVGVKTAGPYAIGSGSSAVSMSCNKGSTTSVDWGSATENSGVYAMNWAKYLLNKANITTQTVGLLGPNCNPYYSTLLDATSTAGGTTFIPTNDLQSMATGLSGAFSSIIASNTVFASVSLPVSVNMQSQYANQVFVGMFRPDENFHPRWYGNIKQYKLAFTSDKSNVILVDADGTAAIDSRSGFVQACARSFWTPTALNTYWANDPSGTCTMANSTQSDYPDGNVVEKGAQAYMLRSLTGSPASNSRVIKTCGSTMASCTSTLTDFSTSNTTLANSSVTVFGAPATDTTPVSNYINWARGQNIIGETALSNMSPKNQMIRPSVHGDVVHSRPVAVDYGGNVGVVVFYGANDGMLHAISGNQTTSSSSTYTAGSELWAFMPPEFYGNISALYANDTFVYYRGTPQTATISKPYGVDGPMTAVKATLNGSMKNYLVATMRRGGRAVYAFDVTNPGSPSLVWKKGCSSASLSSTDCSTGTSSSYANIGQTWAPAKLIYASPTGSATPKPLLLMGGGYDTCEDTDDGTVNNSCTASKGSQVYVIDPADGSIVWSFPTVAPYAGGAPRGVIAEPTVINSNGQAQYAYIADLGGVVYRISLSGSTSSWAMTPIAKLGCDSPAAGCTANRKFMFQASVASADGSTFYVLLGSGDREKPTTQYTATTQIVNGFFMVRDQPANAGYLTGACGTGNNYVCLSSLVKISANGTYTSTGTDKGWYLALAATEQVVTSAVTQYGITSFSTHQPAVPSATSCSNTGLGTTRVYNINYATGAPIGSSAWAYVSGGGLPPSPVAGTVSVDGTSVPFCIGCSADSPLQAHKSSQASDVSRAKGRLYWYLQKN